MFGGCTQALFIWRPSRTKTDIAVALLYVLRLHASIVYVVTYKVVLFRMKTAAAHCWQYLWIQCSLLR